MSMEGAPLEEPEVAAWVTALGETGMSAVPVAGRGVYPVVSA